MATSSNPVGGVGGGLLAIGTGTTAAAVLPSTGTHQVVSIALATALALAVWAVSYLAFSRKQTNG